MPETFQLYVKQTSNCGRVPLTSFERLSPEFTDEQVEVRFEQEGEQERWLSVVGWSELFMGSAASIHVCWVCNQGHIGVLVYGRDAGIRVLDERVEPQEGINDHLPKGYGFPWIWLEAHDITENLKEEVLTVIGASLLE